jgi:hypothetical protein
MTVPLQPARLQSLGHVHHHFRIAAQHDLCASRREGRARGALEPLVRDCLRHPAGECAGVLLAAHERHCAEAVAMLRSHRFDRIAIGEIGGMPHRVDQDHLAEALPGRIASEH